RGPAQPRGTVLGKFRHIHHHSIGYWDSVVVPGLEPLAHHDRVLDRGGVVVGAAADLLEAVAFVEVPGHVVRHADLEEEFPDATLAHIFDHGVHEALRDPAPPLPGRDRDVPQLALLHDRPARRVADDSALV